MTVLQFEPWLWKDVTDYPDLGCAMLMGSYRKNGIDAHLICTQSVYIEELFLREIDCIKALFQSAPASIHAKYADLGIEDDYFPNVCRQLYCRYYSHRWNDYFDAELTLSFKKMFTRLTALQFDLLKENQQDVPLLKILRRHLSVASPQIAAISLYEFDEDNRVLLRTLRSSFPDITFIIGGAFTAHLSNSDIFLLRDAGFADYLSIGPGEVALPTLIQSLLRGIVTFPHNIIPLNGNMPYSLVPTPIRKLNDVASPDFTESRVNRYACPHPLLPLQSARGCVWRKCTFCSHHRGYYGEYHTFQITRLVNDMKGMEALFGCKWFILHDDDIPVQRLLLLGKELYDQHLDYRIYAYVRADEAFLNAKVADQLYRYGIRGLSFGIESGSQKILNSIHKGIRSDVARNILKATNAAGISNTCWMMVNLPGESNDDLQESIEFMTQTAEDVDLWLVSPFRPQYDSPIYGSMDHSEELPRPPFSCSVPLNEQQLREENRISDIINRLFAARIFENPKMPLNKLPIGSQRSRLIPFLYRDSLSLDECMRQPFQLYSNLMLKRLGKKMLLIGAGKRNLIISEHEANLWGTLLQSRLLLWEQLSEEEKSLLKETLMTNTCIAYSVGKDMVQEGE